MNDMTPVIVPKSDQISADDLIAGPMTVTIRDVKITPGAEQPVSMMLEETDRAFRPCKSMSRVFVQAWGPDAKAYIGRSVTLYRDPTVKWGGMEVGGIRISHMSNLDGPKQMMLTATKGSRKPHKVMPLDQAPTAKKPANAAEKWAGGYIANLATFTTIGQLDKFADEKAAKLAELESSRPDLHGQVTAALNARRAELQTGFTDDAEDPLAPWLKAIEAAADLATVDKLDKDSEVDRAFMTEAQIEKLDEALAVKRAGLRENAEKAEAE